jgi:ubiquinol-cytochrome c reductase iron-sulfur subunit
VLVRLPPSVQRRAASAAVRDAPEGLVAYSKVCTHAGCPVGLYEAQTHQLLCPCHQSVFDVLADAVPVTGPAARALPRLPLAVTTAGLVVATGDFSAPVGPAWWSRP